MKLVDRRALVAGLATVLLLATGCARGGDTARWAAPKPSSWDQVLSQIDENGAVSLQTALTGFAVAFGPLPGGPAPEPARVESGTLAIYWIMKHWGELTAEQQAAARAAIAGGVTPTASPPRRAGGLGRSVPDRAPAADPNLDCPSADVGADVGKWRAMVGDLEARLAEQVGPPLYSSAGSARRSDQFKVVLAVNTKQNDTGADRTVYMYTHPCDYDPATKASPEYSGCAVHLNPAVFAAGYSDADRRAALAHELAHCVQLARFGEQLYDLPDWYVEGFPTWLMTVVGGSLGPAVHRYDEWYLDHPDKSLYQRSYDAVGFFAHLAETGTAGLGAKFTAIGKAILGAGGATAAGNRAGWDASGVSPEFLDSWGAGFVRGRYPGKPWNTGGPGLPADHQPTIAGRALGNDTKVTLSAPVAGAAVTLLDVKADVLTVVAGTGAAGRFATGLGKDLSLAEAAGTTFCARPGGCQCPPGSAGAGATFTALTGGPNYLGVTGGPQAATVEATGLSLDSFCAKESKGCLLGSWVTTHAEATLPGTVSEAGGPGVRIDIGKDGSFVVDFAQMGPVQFTGLQQEFQGSFVYRGKIVSAIALPPPGASSGNFQVLHGDWSTVVAQVALTKPFAADLGSFPLAELAGKGGATAGIDAQPFHGGGWQCVGNALTLTNVPGSRIQITWNLTRTG